MRYRECHLQSLRSLFIAAVLFAAAFISGCGYSASSFVAKGEEYLAKRKFHDALMQFRSAAEIDDNLAAAHWGLARAHENLGQYNEAVEEIKKTIHLDGSNLEAKVRLGNYQLMTQPPMIAETEALRDEILAADPKYVEGHILSASIMAAEGRPDAEVLVWVEYAIGLDPARIESYISLQRLHMTRDNAAEAENAIKRGLAMVPDSVKGHTEYGRMLMYAGRDVEAEEKFKKAISLNGSDIEAREAIAEFYIASRQMEKAEQANRELVEIQENSPESRLVLARFFAEAGRADDAERELENILEEHPSYALARYRLIETFLERRDSAKATEHLNALFAINDQDIEALLLRARLKNSENKGEEAVKDLEEVLKRFPSKRDALFLMAQARLSLGQVDQANAFILDLERYHPTYIRTGLLKIQSAITAGDMQNVVKLSGDLIDRTNSTLPNSENGPQEIYELRLRGTSSRGLAYLDLGKNNEAKADLEAVLRENPRSVTALVNMAKYHDAVAEQALSLELYERAVSVDPQSFDAINGVVTSSVRLGRTANAHEKLTGLLERNAGKADVLAALRYLRSTVFVAEKNMAEAENELKAAIELDGSYLPAYSAYASLLAGQGRLDDAAAQYQAVLAKRPSAQIYTLVGILEDSRGRRSEAEAAYRKALELNASTPIAANNLAWLIAESGGNLDEALNLASSAVSKSPNTAGFYDTLGWVYLKKGLSRPAAEQFRKAVALDEQAKRKGGANPGYRVRLGMALAQNGDKAGARREVETSLRSAGELSSIETAEAKRVLASL
ncbi:MAG: tetratricopeptide repeat protein [Acidobacteriota bacterium]|nr:MAG: tetratricopeptide repeat protein [Acidobacteriota bacterium]